jgi:transcriptional regulator with XRE-family HTH domain
MNTKQRDRRQSDAEKISAAMDEQHITAAELHRRTGMAENTIGRVLRGRGSAASVRRLNEALGLQPRTLAQVEMKPDYPPDIIAVQLMVAALMKQVPESEWQRIGEEVAAVLLAHKAAMNATGQ